MRSNRYLNTSLLLAFVFVMAGVPKALAALTPSITLSAVGSNSVQVTVSGADPDATAMLNYTSATTGFASLGLGLTNASGYLSVTVNPATFGTSYSIMNTSPVYVTVDGAQSSAAYWPTNSSGGSLSLSQVSLNLGVGQSGTITANNVSGTLSITGDTNPGIAIGMVFGSSIVITAFNNTGLVTMNICDSANDCQTLSVDVLPSSVSTFSLSSTAVNLTVGRVRP